MVAARNLAQSPELPRVNGRSAPRDVEEWQQLRRQGGPRSEEKLSQRHQLAAPKPAKQKRKLSAAGRKAISEATKRRWAAKRAEAQSKPTVAKKAASKKSASKKSGKKPQKTSEATVTATAQ